MRFSLGLSVIVSDSSCQVPPITPTSHLTRFRLFQIEITFLLGGFQVPDLASPPSGRYQRGQQEPSANSVETQTFGAKDRILFQVCFGLQIPGCHSNPKSKGGLFSVAFDCSLALGVLRLAVLYTGDHARPLDSFWLLVSWAWCCSASHLPDHQRGGSLQGASERCH